MLKYILALCLLTAPAFSHEWYDHDCCSGKDCIEVLDDTIETLSNGGFRYIPENLKFHRAQVRTSKDKSFHVCRLQYAVNEETRFTPRCIYVRLDY